jgi:hypothetical protein
MKPMSRHFGEIHGIDVSDEMIRRAKENLRGIPHAHPHHTSGSDLAPFADESFDLVYSYAVFQHIPSLDVVMQYLREAIRVMKPGGLLRAQLNGLPQSAASYNTWSGVRISAQQIAEFASENHLQLLALEGIDTQYMWTTLMKRSPGWFEGKPDGSTRIRRITNSHSSEPVAPTRGRYSSVTLWMENLSEKCDLNHLTVSIGGREAFACYIGPPEADGLQQVNVMLPRSSATGLLPLAAAWNGLPLAPECTVRVIPPGPHVPMLLSVTDGVNMLSEKTIISGTVKVIIEETTAPETFEAWINGQAIKNIEVFCADPLPPRFEINFQLPAECPAGRYSLEMALRHRKLPPVEIEVQ